MFRYLSPKIILQIALGGTFLYVGVSIFLNPVQWQAFIPSFIDTFMSQELALYLHGAGDIILGLWVFSGKWRFWSGWVSFLWLFSITAVSGSAFWFITFRDVGLALAALAYAYIEKEKTFHIG